MYFNKKNVFTTRTLAMAMCVLGASSCSKKNELNGATLGGETNVVVIAPTPTPTPPPRGGASWSIVYRPLDNAGYFEGPHNSEVFLSHNGEFTSTDLHSNLSSHLVDLQNIDQSKNRSYKKIEVSLDIEMGDFVGFYSGNCGSPSSPKPCPNQYELMTLLRSDRWSTNALGYLAFGVSRNAAGHYVVDLIANTNHRYPAGCGYRISKRANGVIQGGTYHIKYVYDVTTQTRTVTLTGTGVASPIILSGALAPAPGDGSDPCRPSSPIVINSIDVTSKGFMLGIGGEPTNQPSLQADRSTAGWVFRNAVVRGLLR